MRKHTPPRILDPAPVRPNPFDAERDRLIDLRARNMISAGDYAEDMRAIEREERKASVR